MNQITVPCLDMDTDPRWAIVIRKAEYLNIMHLTPYWFGCCPLLSDATTNIIYKQIMIN